MRLLTVTRYLVFVALLISQLSVPIARAEPAGTPVSGDVSDARLRSVEASGEGANWLAHGRGYGEQRYSPLGQIDNGNVAQLGLAWSFDVGNRFVMQTTPLALCRPIKSVSLALPQRSRSTEAFDFSLSWPWSSASRKEFSGQMMVLWANRWKKTTKMAPSTLTTMRGGAFARS